MNPTDEVGKISYAVTIDTAQLKADAKTVEAQAKKAGDGIETGISDGSQKAEAALNKFKAVAIGAFVAIGAASVMAGKQAVDNAINLSESINAVEKTFDGASETILKWGKTAETQAGLSKAAFNTAVVPIGAMLRNMGYDAEGAAESSIKLASRAADLASVFNTDLDSALTAIQAGLRGEADPLERFGVGLNETSVKAYALQAGMIAAGDEMTAAQKTTARLGLLFKQTDRFAGDFVQTSGEAANKSRILAARYENLSASVGGKLVPVYGRLLDAGEFLVANFGNIVGAIKPFTPLILTTTAALGGYAIAAGAVRLAVNLATTAQLLFNAASKANPIGLAIGALSGLAAIFSIVSQRTDTSKAAQDRLNSAREAGTAANNALTLSENTLKDAQLRVEGSTLAVERAQRSYTEALNQYGPESLEAREAALQLKNAQRELEQANTASADATNANTQAQKDFTKAKDEIVNAQNAVASATGNAASQYQILANSAKEATKAQAEIKKQGYSTPSQQLKAAGIPSMNTQGRASGGSVSANRPYFVGENKDGSLNSTSELFVPRTSGSIMNSSDLQKALNTPAGAQGNTYQITIPISGAIVTSPQDQRKFAEVIGKRLNEIMTQKGYQPSIKGV